MAINPKRTDENHNSSYISYQFVKDSEDRLRSESNRASDRIELQLINLGASIEKLNTKLDNSVEKLNTKLDKSVEKMNTRFDNIERQFFEIKTIGFALIVLLVFMNLPFSDILAAVGTFFKF